MGVFSGSVQYVRYFVGGALSEKCHTYEDNVLFRRFVPLKEQGEDLEAEGWVLAQRPFAAEDAMTANDFGFEHRLVLAYRRDRILLPRPVLREEIRKRIETQRKELGSEPSFKTKKAIEEAVCYEMRQKVLPKSQIADICLDLKQRELRVFGRGKALLERVEKLVEQTFMIQLKPKNFAAQALAFDLSLRDKGQLETLLPHEIFRPHQASRWEQ